MQSRPVLYLDVDDTLLTYHGTGEPRAAPGAPEFLRWAVERFTVRWLTSWCPEGELPERKVRGLCVYTGLEPELVRGIRGLDWSCGASKLGGIAWVEHLVLGRPFLWIEDEKGVGEPERAALAALGLSHCYRECNVTREPEALMRLHARLRREALPGSRDRRTPEEIRALRERTNALPLTDERLDGAAVQPFAKHG